VTGTSFSGALTLNGLGVVLNIDRGSLPLTINPILNGAILNVINDLITQDVVSSLNNTATPLTSTNVVIDKFTYTADMSGKVSTGTTVNGHALTANVTVGASELGAGTVPRTQLPLPWLSADIPNNSANTLGSAASLSAISDLPNGTTATTQGSVAVPDNSTKLATTAYVDRLRGTVSGVATLDGTGKIPIGQIDLGAIGALTYKGTWDASTAVYPTPIGLVSGWFYITSVSGTISGTLYNVGDWMIYNGASWDRVAAVDIGAYLSTWTGSASVVTLGTITTGKWHADQIEAAYGGAGGIAGPALLKGTAGVVSAAAVDTDYVSPSTAATIAGDKYFSGNTTAVTQTSTDSSTKLATTAYVQAAANVSQKQVIYLSGNGNDTLNGQTLSNAVLTLGQAVALCIAGGAALSKRYVIRCMDASTYNGTALPSFSWIDFDASSVQLTGEVTLADNNAFVIKAINTPAVAKGVLLHFAGGTNTLTTFMRAHRLSAGQIVVDSTQGTRSVDIDYIDGLPLTSDPVITCNANSILYVKAIKIRGLITATGTNAIVDLTQVGNLTEATFSIGLDPGCTIRFPAGGAGNVAGLLKGNGAGVIVPAVPGTGNDYLTANDTITLSSDVTGSGTTAITTTIAPSAVTFAKMANLAANSLIGNSTGAPATPSAVQMSAASNPSQVAVRDANSNLWANHMTEGILGIPTTGGTTSFTAATPAYIQFTGVSTQVVVLPDATTITIGYRFSIYNGSTLPITIEDHGATLLFTQNSTVTTVCICANTSTASGVWIVSPIYQTRTLTGDVTGSGAETTATTIAAGAVTTSKMANFAANSIIANTTGAPAAPSSLTITSSGSTASSAVLRDSSANISGNAVIQRYRAQATAAGTTTLLISDPPIEEFTGTLTQTVLLPDATLGMTTGYTVTVINSSSGALTVQTSTANLVRTMPADDRCAFICNALSNAASSWTADAGPQSGTVTLTGGVTGAGPVGTSIATTIGTGAVSWGVGGSLAATLASGNVLGNLSGGATAPVAVQAVATNTASSIVARDASSNVYLNQAVELTDLPVGNVVLTVASSPVQYYAETVVGNFSVRLPNATTLTVGFRFTIINDATGTISVNNASSTLLLNLSKYMRATFVCSNTGTGPGVWEISMGSMFPSARLFTTAAPLTTSQTLTCTQLYGGPVMSNVNNVTLTLPSAANFFTQMAAILGYSPPIGFNFQTTFMSITNTMTIAAGGAYRFPGTTKTVVAARCAVLTFWVEDNAANRYDVTVVVSAV
jgi:hypothetical protein